MEDKDAHSKTKKLTNDSNGGSLSRHGTPDGTAADYQLMALMQC